MLPRAEETAILTGQPTTFFFNDNPVAEIMRVPGVASVSPEVYIATLSAPAARIQFNLSGSIPVKTSLSLRGCNQTLADL